MPRCCTTSDALSDICGADFEFDYAFHVLPTVRFKLSYMVCPPLPPRAYAHNYRNNLYTHGWRT